MSCHNHSIDLKRAKCKSAVMCAYKCLMSDEPHCVAMEAAQKVYAYHNPDADKACVENTVEHWVAEDSGRIH